MSAILIVDDEIDIAETLVKTFEMYGYDSDCAGSGQEAIEMIEKNSYDVIISDIHMPGMSGTELFTHLKQNNMFNGPFIFITGFATPSEIESPPFRSSKVFHKPFLLNELLDYVYSVIS